MTVRVGLLRRGDRSTHPPVLRKEAALASLRVALAGRGVEVEAVAWADDAAEEVVEQLSHLDAVVVWVNPIEEGATRARLDEALRRLAERGLYVSAHPDVIAVMGTKEVLYRTRDFTWGSDVAWYATPAELAERLPARLDRYRRLVVKQARGNGGQGTWSVERLDAGPEAGRVSGATPVRVRHAQTKDASSTEMTLADFVDSCAGAFGWSNGAIDQPYQERLAEGMVRAYLSGGEVVGFARQWPGGLIEPGAREATPPSFMTGPERPEWQGLRRRLEATWVPQLQRRLGLDAPALPVLWDADFFFGPAEDSWVLCEINASSVAPFPDEAADGIASSLLARLGARRP
jgi:hypothetical protein